MKSAKPKGASPAGVAPDPTTPEEHDSGGSKELANTSHGSTRASKGGRPPRSVISTMMVQPPKSLSFIEWKVDKERAAREERLRQRLAEEQQRAESDRILGRRREELLEQRMATLARIQKRTVLAQQRHHRAAANASLRRAHSQKPDTPGRMFEFTVPALELKASFEL
jgi:hypothetical protein